MEHWINKLLSFNFVSIFLLFVIVVSIYHGMSRGGTRSTKHLFNFLLEGLLTCSALFLSWKFSNELSALLQSWLISLNLSVPNQELNWFQQIYYTLITSIRDFSLLRYGIIFLLCFVVLKNMAYYLVMEIFRLRERWKKERLDRFQFRSRVWSNVVGGVMGAILGGCRAVLLIAGLFIYVTLFPQAPFTQYIQASEAYQEGAEQIIQPITGDFFEKEFPVFTRNVEAEFSKILQRKYEVIDSNIPENILEAAKQITLNADSDEEKARALYRWVGTRIQYDWEKVRVYEEENKWLEQTPEDTYRTRLGVCIDYSRLYALMARSVDLEVRVVTGLGYDGRGGYGSHAWNEVYITGRDEWIPLDTTWVSSGGNWFNPANFNETHIKDA